MIVIFLILFRHVIPLLKEFVVKRGSNSMFKHFDMPNYIAGRNGITNNPTSHMNGSTMNTEHGIIILEDLSTQGYNLVDPDLMMFNIEQMTVICVLLNFSRHLSAQNFVCISTVQILHNLII